MKIGSKFLACSLFASIGKTPPYWAWIFACDKTILARTFSPSISAKAVSSQLVSIPKISADFFGIFLEIIFIPLDLVIGENPDVSVGHFIADYFGENPIGAEGLLLGQGDFFGDFKKIANVREYLPAGRQVPNPSIVFFWDNLSVAGALRLNIQKSQKILVLINNFRRNFLSSNFAKYAIGHNQSISC